MKYIKEKSSKNEPTSLIETRSTPGSTFDDCNKQDIRFALLQEQGYICAYCMKRIDNGKNQKGLPNTRIEHFKAQSLEVTLKMNYYNMLGVCDGREGNPKHLLTCDKRRDNQNLTIDPRKKSCEEFVAYRNNGVIYSTNSKIDTELNEVLGLNDENLIRERGGAIKMANQRLQRLYKKTKNKTWSRSDITKEINYWKARKNSNKYEEYCMAAVHYLEKKLARL